MQTRVRVGTPREGMVQRALSVMADVRMRGSHSKGGSSDGALGGTARHRTRRAPCTVLRVSPKASVIGERDDGAPIPPPCANAGVERYGQASAEGKRRPPESPSSTKHPRRWRCPIAFLWLRSVGFRTGQSIKIDGGVIVWYITSVSWASRGKSDHRRMRGAPEAGPAPSQRRGQGVAVW